MTDRGIMTPGPFDFSTSADLTGEQVRELREAIEKMDPAARHRVLHLNPPVVESEAPVIIVWPQPRPGAAALNGWAIRVLDATTGQPIDTITELVLVHAKADDLIYAEADMIEGASPPLIVRRRFRVAEMRIAPPAEPDFGQMPAGPST